jgi:hypothetical protein
MRLGVWMSGPVWRHKADPAHAVQAWNLAELPELVAAPGDGSRMYVATGGFWRGYFRLQAFSWNPDDSACPFALLFNPRHWTAIPPEPAPPRDRRGYTLDVPGKGIIPVGERDRPCGSGVCNEKKKRKPKRD